MNRSGSIANLEKKPIGINKTDAIFWVRILLEQIILSDIDWLLDELVIIVRCQFHFIFYGNDILVV